MAAVNISKSQEDNPSFWNDVYGKWCWIIYQGSKEALKSVQVLRENCEMSVPEPASVEHNQMFTLPSWSSVELRVHYAKHLGQEWSKSTETRCLTGRQIKTHYTVFVIWGNSLTKLTGYRIKAGSDFYVQIAPSSTQPGTLSSGLKLSNV